MRALRAVLLAMLLGFVLPAYALVAVPQLSGRVVDQTGTLSSGDIAQLTQTLKDLETRKGSQIAILIVPTTDGEAIEQFSLRVAEAWKIGRKKVDDGALLVIAKNDRHLRIEVGYGLEGAITDVAGRRIMDEVITPKFKGGDIAGGISAGIAKMIGLINGEKLPAPEPVHWDKPSDGPDFSAVFNPFWLFFAFVVSGVMRSTLGRLIGSVATGGVLAVLAWLLIGSPLVSLIAAVLGFLFSMVLDLLPAGGGSSGSSGSSSSSSSSDWSGSSSSSSSDSGSFSGGGGSFGGGGASGSW